ncbi:hypothetical protein FHW00_000537 [Ochrobactrum sp. P6BSIII]|nr:hypothetical protein [Ochrobactrum sp. P6BSIII]
MRDADAAHDVARMRESCTRHVAVSVICMGPDGLVF